MIHVDCAAIACECCECDGSEDFRSDDYRSESEEYENVFEYYDDLDKYFCILDDVLGSILPNKSRKVAETEGTPQNRAVNWLISKHDFDRFVEFEDIRIIQRYAMATLFYATDGPSSWINIDGWLSSIVHECEWFSSARELFDYEPCEHGLLKKLVLVDNGLSGTIPFEISILSSLVTMDLSSNDLKGKVPKSIGKMENLEELFLASNSLKGALPFISSLLPMTTLHLADNDCPGHCQRNLDC